jgi:hypothetical protein
MQSAQRIHFVFRVDFMVKLLRACVWMPWRKQAKPEEEKSTEIPKVVASEIGRAQTERFERRARGCRTAIFGVGLGNRLETE